MNSNKNKSSKKKDIILFVSYFLGVKGNCPAEWGDDKLRVLDSLDKKIIIITSIQSNVFKSNNFLVYKVPSLSFKNFKYELSIYRKNNNGKFPILLRVFYLFSFIFGSIYDFTMIKYIKSLTGGYWSWFFISLPLGIYINCKFKINKIFSTAGPPSAHLMSATLAAIFKTKFICEFQDPQVGEYIKNYRSKRIALIFDKFYKKYASKIIFVTKKAAKNSKIITEDYKNKIKAIYPGSWNFIKDQNIPKHFDNKSIEIIHLGTLYTTRNLDNFFIALDRFKANNINNKRIQAIKIINCGDIYLKNKQTYIKRNDFKILQCKSRLNGLKRASKSSFLLLVQHNDWRSKETIPYKFYDYLNLRMPILGITNNKELDSLILKAGGVVAKADSIESIYLAFERLFNKEYEYQPEINFLEIDIKKQFLKALR